MLQSHFPSLRSLFRGARSGRARRVMRWLAVGAGVVSACAVSMAPAQASAPVRNGRLIVTSNAPTCCDIFTMRADGGDVRRLTHFAPGALAVQGIPSPDGRRIVFWVIHPDAVLSPSEVWVMNANGSGQHVLFSDPFFADRTPSYSSDGATVVFSRCRPDFSACALYRVKADGTHMRALTPFRLGVLDLFPRYSPDGRRIAFGGFNRGGVQGAVYLMNPDGTRLRRLTPAWLGSFAPEWSPDSRRLLTQSNCCTSATKSLWRIDATGTGLTRLTHPSGGSNDFHGVWAPAGNWIAFGRAAPDGSRTDLWEMRPDGSQAHLVRLNADPTGWTAAT